MSIRVGKTQDVNTPQNNISVFSSNLEDVLVLGSTQSNANLKMYSTSNANSAFVLQAQTGSIHPAHGVARANFNLFNSNTPIQKISYFPEITPGNNIITMTVGCLNTMTTDYTTKNSVPNTTLNIEGSLRFTGDLWHQDNQVPLTSQWYQNSNTNPVTMYSLQPVQVQNDLLVSSNLICPASIAAGYVTTERLLSETQLSTSLANSNLLLPWLHSTSTSNTALAGLSASYDLGGVYVAGNSLNLQGLSPFLATVDVANVLVHFDNTGTITWSSAIMSTPAQNLKILMSSHSLCGHTTFNTSNMGLYAAIHFTSLDITANSHTLQNLNNNPVNYNRTQDVALVHYSSNSPTSQNQGSQESWILNIGGLEDETIKSISASPVDRSLILAGYSTSPELFCSNVGGGALKINTVLNQDAGERFALFLKYSSVGQCQILSSGQALSAGTAALASRSSGLYTAGCFNSPTYDFTNQVQYWSNVSQIHVTGCNYFLDNSLSPPGYVSYRYCTYDSNTYYDNIYTCNLASFSNSSNVPGYVLLLPALTNIFAADFPKEPGSSDPNHIFFDVGSSNTFHALNRYLSPPDTVNYTVIANIPFIRSTTITLNNTQNVRGDAQTLFVSNFSQLGLGNWIAGMTATLPDSIVSMAESTDSAALYVLGNFSSNIGFSNAANGATSIPSLTRSSARSTGNLFLSRYSSNGTLDWALALGPVSGSNGSTSGRSITVGEDNMLYVSGYSTAASNTWTGYGSLSSLSSFSNTSSNFICKLRPNGECLDVASLQASPALDVDVAMDRSGNIYVASSYSSNSSAFSSQVEFQDLTFPLPVQTNDLFVAKLNPFMQPLSRIGVYQTLDKGGISVLQTKSGEAIKLQRYRADGDMLQAEVGGLSVGRLDSLGNWTIASTASSFSNVSQRCLVQNSFTVCSSSNFIVNSQGLLASNASILNAGIVDLAISDCLNANLGTFNLLQVNGQNGQNCQTSQHLPQQLLIGCNIGLPTITTLGLAFHNSNTVYTQSLQASNALLGSNLYVGSTLTVLSGIDCVGINKAPDPNWNLDVSGTLQISDRLQGQSATLLGSLAVAGTVSLTSSTIVTQQMQNPAIGNVTVGQLGINKLPSSVNSSCCILALANGDFNMDATHGKFKVACTTMFAVSSEIVNIGNNAIRIFAPDASGYPRLANSGCALYLNYQNNIATQSLLYTDKDGQPYYPGVVIGTSRADYTHVNGDLYVNGSLVTSNVKFEGTSLTVNSSAIGIDVTTPNVELDVQGYGRIANSLVIGDTNPNKYMSCNVVLALAGKTNENFNSTLNVMGNACIGFSNVTYGNLEPIYTPVSAPMNGLIVGGQVGIGQSNPLPGVALDVSGSGRFTGGIYVGQGLNSLQIFKGDGTMAGPITISSSFNTSGSSTIPSLTLSDSGKSLLLFVGASSTFSSNPLIVSGDHALIFTNGTIGSGNLLIGPWSSSYAGIYINSSGQVGIGTVPSSIYTLDVMGNIRSRGTETISNSDSSFTTYGPNLSNKSLIVGSYPGNQTSANNAMISSDSTGNLHLSTTTTNGLYFNFYSQTASIKSYSTWTHTGNFTVATNGGIITANLTGNVTGNCTGSSGSCTGNAATATSAGSAASAAYATNAGSGWPTSLSGFTNNLSSFGAVNARGGGGVFQAFLGTCTNDNWGSGCAMDLYVGNNVGASVWMMCDAGSGAAYLYLGAFRFASRDTSKAVRVDQTGNMVVSGNATASTMTASSFNSTGSTDWSTSIQGQYFNRNTGGTVFDPAYAYNSFPYSFYGTNHFIAYGGYFIAYSDQRIKTAISGVWDDLDIVNQLRVRRFTFKDPLRNLDEDESKCSKKPVGRIRVGFFAQEVRQVLPEAITQHSDVIPDIQKVCERDGNTIFIETSTLETEIKMGDTINIVNEDGSNGGTFGFNVKVVGISDSEITVDDGSKMSGSSVFVYGRKVDDLLGLNQDSISSVSIGAIQRLSQICNRQQALIEDLTARLALLEARLSS